MYITTEYSNQIRDSMNQSYCLFYYEQESEHTIWDAQILNSVLTW